MSNLAQATVVLDGDDSGLRAALTGAESAMRSAGERMASIGHELQMKLTLPTLAVGGAAVHTAADFDASMRKIAALTETSVAQVDDWRGRVRQLAIQYGQSSKDAAEALYFISSAGIHGAKAMNTLETALKGSAVGLGALPSVADAAVSAMNAYAKSGLTAQRATEILASGIKYGKLSAESLAPVLGRVTGVAAALGVSFEQVVGTLAVFSHTGTEAEEAAVQLSSLFTVLLNPSKEIAKSLAAHGLSMAALRQEASGAQGLIGVMRTLDQAYHGNVEEIREIIPNVRAFRGVMNALAQDSHFVDSVMQGTANSVGTLDQAWQKSQGPALQLRQSWQKIKDSLIELGNVLNPIVIPAIVSLVNHVKLAANWFASLSPQMQHTIVVAAGMAAALGPALVALSVLPRVMAFALSSSVSLAGGFMSLLTAARGLLFMTGIEGTMKAAIASFGLFEGTLTGVTECMRLLFLQITGPLISGLKRLFLITDIQNAFAAASIAGTGFQGVLAGLLPVLKAVGTTLLTFAAVSAIVGGLALIAIKWYEMKRAVEETDQAIQDAAKHMNDVLNHYSATQADAAANRLRGIIAQHQAQIAVLDSQIAAKEKIPQSVASLPEAAHAQAIQKEIIALKAQRDALGESVVQYAGQLSILQKIVDASENFSHTVTHKVAPAVTSVTPWLTAATDAMDKFHRAMKSAQTMSLLLGAQFKLDEAETKAYSDVVAALAEAGVPLDAVLDAQGDTLRKLGGRLDEVIKKSEADKAIQKERNEIYDQAKQAVQAALTPHQKFAEVLSALDIALANGKISWEEYKEAVRHAQDEMDGTTKMAKELSQAIHDMAGRAVDDFVDMAFGAHKSFKAFVVEAIKDITKLILKIELLKLLFPADKGGKFLGGILGFANGGFLQTGEIGLVGERGPELISGGRTGVTVTPLPASSANMGAGGDSVAVNLSVYANDSRDVQRFFEENEELVAGTMVRAFQKSAALRRVFSRAGG